MGAATGIAWTDATFNPWWGCQRVSPGCEHCYAEAFAKRVGFSGRTDLTGAPNGEPKLWGPLSPRRFFGDAHWGEPRKWNDKATREGARRRVFCASMADVFEDRRDLDEPRARLFSLIEETSSLDWQLLTKRPENMRTLAPSHWAYEWPANVWAGTTTEDQKHYDIRWPRLAMIPARVRFISHEPALGHLELREAIDDNGLKSIPDWIITGGESGGGCRPYDVRWAYSLVAATRGKASTCLFVKQLGGRPVDGEHQIKLQASKGDDPGEWPERLRVQEFPGGTA